MNDAIPDRILRLAEAHLFAASGPMTTEALAGMLADAGGWALDTGRLLQALVERHAGRGFELVQVAGGWQFRTAADLAEALRPTHQLGEGAARRLPRAAMETLVLIAYRQPVTRPEMEALLGHSVSQPGLDLLLEAGLIRHLGRKDVPGRPMLWGTTPHFLAMFGLRDLTDLPGFGT
jgi:segregation and condensation protein B